MESGEKTYIWQQPDWPAWRFDIDALAGPLAEASQAQGRLLGRLADGGWPLRGQASVRALTDDVVKTSAIEGESLDEHTVRSSVARRLGVDVGALAPADRHVDGVVDMVLDATRRYDEELTVERLLGWHASLFPDQRLLSPIRIGAWRDDASGPMQVVSGPLHRQRVHYEAPPAARVPAEVERFLAWANADSGEPALLKAGLAHLWFVTVHPFDDGNGRIARAVGDLFLARSDRSAERFYSLSSQIQRERRHYYGVLERTQKDSLDATAWLAWFLHALLRAFESAQASLDTVMAKARFWQRWAQTPLNARQVKLLNRVLDGLDGKLTSTRWAHVAKCSPDTALRDISALIAFGVLRQAPGGGRSTAYELAG